MIDERSHHLVVVVKREGVEERVDCFTQAYANYVKDRAIESGYEVVRVEQVENG